MIHRSSFPITEFRGQTEWCN